jgi:hypothetical protein
MAWVAGGTARDPLHQAMLGGTFGRLRAWRVSWERLGTQGLMDLPRNRGKALSLEMRSFGGKGIAQNQSAPISAFVAFFCHIPLQSYLGIV